MHREPDQPQGGHLGAGATDEAGPGRGARKAGARAGGGVRKARAGIRKAGTGIRKAGLCRPVRRTARSHAGRECIPRRPVGRTLRARRDGTGPQGAPRKTAGHARVPGRGLGGGEARSAHPIERTGPRPGHPSPQPSTVRLIFGCTVRTGCGPALALMAAGRSRASVKES
ncbi:hypothetical protein GCM10010324_02610 [Streptomyces hiroshimensis]|uniref:Uncharacterized protein n=1 Tax=Streptomyces hiroshimensis TaxID=66424 RepID=A0ABQ2Y3D8_9ACTN|nr:hypothetical protein GCM10010324_02610 [Streptomyces hiroshimensis]